MPIHHFISYSTVDALDFALKLHDELEAGPPPISVWLDKRHLEPGLDWDQQLAGAIHDCESLIFVMTPDSVEDHSTCKQEWTHTLKYKKPIVPIRLHRNTLLPFRLKRQYIDFTGSFEAGMARLRNHLQWLSSPAGALQAMKDRLADARTTCATRPTPTGHASRTTSTCWRGRSPTSSGWWTTRGPRATSSRASRPDWSTSASPNGPSRARQPRSSSTRRRRRAGLLPGSSGRKSGHRGLLEGRKLPADDVGGPRRDRQDRAGVPAAQGAGGRPSARRSGAAGRGRDRLPERGGHTRINFPNLFADLCKLLPNTAAAGLDALYRNPQVSTAAKMNALLAAFPGGQTGQPQGGQPQGIAPTTGVGAAAGQLRGRR